MIAYPSSENLVDGSALFERALGHHLCPHLLHVKHERVQRFLDMRLLFFYSCLASSIVLFINLSFFPSITKIITNLVKCCYYWMVSVALSIARFRPVVESLNCWLLWYRHRGVHFCNINKCK